MMAIFKQVFILIWMYLKLRFQTHTEKVKTKTQFSIFFLDDLCITVKLTVYDQKNTKLMMLKFNAEQYFAITGRQAFRYILWTSMKFLSLNQTT